MKSLGQCQIWRKILINISSDGGGNDDKEFGVSKSITSQHCIFR